MKVVGEFEDFVIYVDASANMVLLEQTPNAGNQHSGVLEYRLSYNDIRSICGRINLGTNRRLIFNLLFKIINNVNFNRQV